MIFQDNVIREYLRNVYFITGTPCGGKTTVSRRLAERHGLTVYDIDQRFEEHRCMSRPEYQPAMNRSFLSADEFFGRTVEEYKQWLLSNTREQLDFVLLDLIRLSREQIVLCDCHLSMEDARRLTDPSRIVFLIKDPSDLVEEYCNRHDHQDFSDFINSASDPAQAKRVCSRTLRELNEGLYTGIRNSEFFWLERTADSTVENTVSMVERHFSLA